MTHRALAFALALYALPIACGGEQPAPTQPSNAAPSASAASTAPAAASESPAASAAPTPTAAPAPSAAPSSSAAAAPAAPPPPAAGEWDKWSKDDKLAYMKTAVMPKMGAAFHDFDSTRYGETKCVLCHGAAAKTGSFKMPNPDLPKLPASPADFKKLHDQKPKVFDFMVQTVEQQMAALVGEAPYDPKTNKGFGCFECHTKKK